MPDRAREAGAVPPPVVSQQAYDEDYYRNRCAGAGTWSESGGLVADDIYLGSLLKFGLRPGDTLIDIGTGRGEMLAVAIDQGAGRAIGVEYSEAAVKLAQQTIDVREVGDRCEVLLSDARRIPLPDDSADIVTMLDVVEHLAPAELAATFGEAHRLLRPGGRLVGHTLPTSTIYDVTYRWQRLLRPSRRRTWPVNPRNEYELRMHVNEQTLHGLRRTLKRSGFAPVSVAVGEWLWVDFVPDPRARRTYNRLSRFRWLKQFGTADLWFEATKPARSGTSL